MPKIDTTTDDDDDFGDFAAPTGISFSCGFTPKNSY